MLAMLLPVFASDAVVGLVWWEAIVLFVLIDWRQVLDTRVRGLGEIGDANVRTDLRRQRYCSVCEPGRFEREGGTLWWGLGFSCQIPKECRKSSVNWSASRVDATLRGRETKKRCALASRARLVVIVIRRCSGCTSTRSVHTPNMASLITGTPAAVSDARRCRGRQEERGRSRWRPHPFPIFATRTTIASIGRPS